VHERRKSAMLTTTILNSIPQIDQIDLPHSTWIPGHCNVDSLSSKGEEKSSKPRCHTPQKTATHTCRYSPDLITQHTTQRPHPPRKQCTTALMLPSQNPSSQMQPQTQESRSVRTSHFRKPNVGDGRARAHLFANRKCNTSIRSSSRFSRAAMA
jgi:hypothetical protein